MSAVLTAMAAVRIMTACRLLDEAVSELPAGVKARLCPDGADLATIIENCRHEIEAFKELEP